VTQNNVPTPMYILARLNYDSQGISVAQEYAELKVTVDAAPLKNAFAAKNADKDVSTIVVPPPQMVANMKVGNMDAFCVGEPWNEQLVNQGIGYTACTTGEIWKNHPEKALGMRAAFVDANPAATQAILMAVMEAQQWCDEMANKEEMAQILGRRQWFNVPPKDVLGRLKGDINYGNGRVATGTDLYMKFWKGGVSYPFKSHDAWFVTEDMRWGKFEPSTDVKALVDKVNREDLWRAAAKQMGVAAADIPASASRGKETFFDGKVFDPENPTAYLASLDIKRVA